MAKGDDWLGALAVLAGIGAGIWLLGKALSPSTKKINYYRCWNCNKLLLPNTKRCPHCGSDIDWSNVGFA